MDPSPPSPDAALIGRIVAGKYRIDAVLGRGGRGEVYRALQVDLARDVALKRITGVDDDACARFLQEARLAAEVRHPCVVEVFDAGVDKDGTPYCAMELLDGETLAERLAREGPLEVQQAVTVIAGVCSALSAVHGRGLVHRDVKPSNIFLARRPDGGIDPKLIDFGIAKRVQMAPEAMRRVTTARGLGPALTAPHLIVGTPRYLSPEQILGGALDARTDVYAVAVTLYEALSGTPLYRVAELAELFGEILTTPPEPLGERAPDAGIPDALDREIRRALAKDPAERHASATDFAAALWTALARALSDPAIAPVPVPGTRQRDAVVAVFALAALLLGGAFVWVRSAPRPAPPPPAPIAAPLVAVVLSAGVPDEPAPAPASPAETAPVISSPRPRAAGARPPSSQAPTVTPTAAPSASAYRIDDLKIPY